MGIAKGANDLKVADLQHDAEYARPSSRSCRPSVSNCRTAWNKAWKS